MSIRNWAIGLVAAVAIAAPATALTATSASAATVKPATVAAHHAPHFFGTLQGPNTLKLVYGSTTYTYKVDFSSFPAAPGVRVITGTLRDKYEPVPLNLPLYGVQFGRNVVFSESYPTVGPDAGTQGVRTFSGSISFFGHVSGTWSETGAEGGSGTWYLVFPA